MAALFSALDNFTPSKIGENGHSEFTWSNNTRERILQLSFQLTRTTSDYQIDNLAQITDQILTQLTCNYNMKKIERSEYIEHISIMFRLVGHTRDIVDGKGEYTLSYMLLSVWYKHNPSLALFAFQCFIYNNGIIGNSEGHPYGSWKDIKYMIKYMEQHNTGEELIEYAIKLMNSQIRMDEYSETPSLAAKWVPREKSAFGFLFEKIAKNYFTEYIDTAKTNSSRFKAMTKAKMDYRKIISRLNRQLDTVQINQCANTWSLIEPSKQTSITMHKQKKAFLNKTKNGEQKNASDDRIQCAKNFEDFALKAEKGIVEIKGKRIGLNDFTKDALQLINHGQHSSSEAQILNAQWLNNSLQTGKLGKLVAMVDTSGSMEGEPMNAAIALGLRIAEKSLLGKRVLTFCASPSWVNLESCDNFVSMVSLLKDSNWGMNTNFNAALNLILDAIIQQKLAPDDVEDMVLAILSDMQIDQANPNYGSMMELIDQKYADTGMRLWKKPFKPPHILFWNLKSTSGFPTLSSRKNVSMMSGFSPALLNLFCEEGLDALQTCSPWSLFVKGLSSDRYQILDTRLRDEFINV
jgi:Mg-chelatase subunit ChlD